jgi:hypothetical protein
MSFFKRAVPDSSTPSNRPRAIRVARRVARANRGETEALRGDSLARWQLVSKTVGFATRSKRNFPFGK